MGFYGVVYDGMFSNHDSVLADARRKQARVNVVLNSHELAVRLADELPSTSIVVVRHTFDEKTFDANGYRNNPQLLIKTIFDLGYDSRLYYEFENEPSVPGEDDPDREAWVEAHAAWLLECMAFMRAYGMKGVIGNWATWWPLPADIEGGYKPVLQAVADDPTMLIGVHVYYAISYTSPLTTVMVSRVKAMLDAVPRLYGKIILTETGSDWFVQYPKSGPWKDVGSDRDYWLNLLGMFELLRNLGVLGTAIFIWMERGDSIWHRKYSIHGQSLNEWIANHNFGEWLGGELNTGDMIMMKVRPLVNTNIRADYGLQATVINHTGLLELTGEETEMLVGSSMYIKDGWRWARFGSPVNGWMATVSTIDDQVLVELSPVEGPPVDPPPVDPPPVNDELETFTREMSEYLAVLNSSIGDMAGHFETGITNLQLALDGLRDIMKSIQKLQESLDGSE